MAGMLCPDENKLTFVVGKQNHGPLKEFLLR